MFAVARAIRGQSTSTITFTACLRSHLVKISFLLVLVHDVLCAKPFTHWWPFENVLLYTVMNRLRGNNVSLYNKAILGMSMRLMSHTTLPNQGGPTWPMHVCITNYGIEASLPRCVYWQTHVRVSKINAVARAQLIYQMLTLLQNIYTVRASVQKYGTANVWPWWTRRLGVRVPRRSRQLLSRKLWHFHKNTRSCVENECCYPRTVNISNLNFTSKIHMVIRQQRKRVSYPAS